MEDKFPGGHGATLAEGESVYESGSEDALSSSAHSRTGKPGTPGGVVLRDGQSDASINSANHRPGSQSLPRSAGPDVLHVSGTTRKVDSLPNNLSATLPGAYVGRGSSERDDSYTDRKRRPKGMIKSIGQFVQKVARQITAVSSLAKSKATGTGSETTSSTTSGVNGQGESKEDRTNGEVGVGDDEPKKTAGVIGIHNHGNTCYMNAVIQCLSNTERLLNYFVTDQYKDDIKRNSRRNSRKFGGTHGELTEQLAKLLRSIWTCTYTPEVSVDFKAIVGKYGVQYRGAAQHDAQEFLMWILDKVHEDLNIATKKKYRANKSSFGRSDEDIAAEALANHARCNNSFVYDIFQASYRSSLACPNCGHRSNTFDPFLSVSLPIPHQTRLPVFITVVRGLITENSPATIGPPRQIRWGLLLDQDCLVKEMRQVLCAEAKIDSANTLLLLELDDEGFSQTFSDTQSVCDLSEIDNIYAVEIALTALPSLTAQPQPATILSKVDNSLVIADTVTAIPLCVEKPSKATLDTNPVIDRIIPPSDDQPIKIDVGVACVEETNETGGAVQEIGAMDTEKLVLLVCVNKLIGTGTDGVECSKRFGCPVAVCLPARSSFIFICDRIEQVLGITTQTLASHGLKPEPTQASSAETVGDLGPSMNIEVAVSSSSSGGRGYSLLLINDYQADYYLTAEQEFPLCAEIVDKTLSNWVPAKSHAHIKIIIEWTKEAKDRCFPMVPSTTTTTLGLDLSEKQSSRSSTCSLDQTRSMSFGTVEDDDSVKQVKIAQQQTTIGTLDECFQVYTREERLDADNAWLCPSCRKYQNGTLKALSLWSLPEILVIHLKRFRQDAVQRAKLNTLVTFPVRGLDLRHHVQKQCGSNVNNNNSPGGSSVLGSESILGHQQQHGYNSSMTGGGKLLGGGGGGGNGTGSWKSWKPGKKAPESSDEFVYDLYAVCNHYGNMQGGHYTAFCKNPANNRWYSFNDANATEMHEEEVITRAAYLIFYQKRSSAGAVTSRGGGGGGAVELKEWLQRLRLTTDCTMPRTVTSHSLDDLLDGGESPATTTMADSAADESFRATIPVYTELSPPARITRHTSIRHTASLPPHTSTPTSERAASSSIPRSNLAVQISVTTARPPESPINGQRIEKNSTINKQAGADIALVTNTGNNSPHLTARPPIGNSSSFQSFPGTSSTLTKEANTSARDVNISGIKNIGDSSQITSTEFQSKCSDVNTSSNSNGNLPLHHDGSQSNIANKSAINARVDAYNFKISDSKVSRTSPRNSLVRGGSPHSNMDQLGLTRPGGVQSVSPHSNMEHSGSPRSSIVRSGSPRSAVDQSVSPRSSIIRSGSPRYNMEQFGSVGHDLARPELMRSSVVPPDATHSTSNLPGSRSSITGCPSGSPRSGSTQSLSTRSSATRSASPYSNLEQSHRVSVSQSNSPRSSFIQPSNGKSIDGSLGSVATGSSQKSKVTPSGSPRSSVSSSTFLKSSNSSLSSTKAGIIQSGVARPGAIHASPGQPNVVTSTNMLSHNEQLPRVGHSPTAANAPNGHDRNGDAKHRDDEHR